MKYSELLQLFFERSNEIVNYWTIYIVGMAAMLSFFAVRTRLDRRTKLILTAGFLFLAVFNLVGLLSVNNQRKAVIDVIKGSHADFLLEAGDKERDTVQLPIDKVEPTFRPFQNSTVIVIHLFSDGIALFGIWMVAPERTKKTRAEPARAAQS